MSHITVTGFTDADEVLTATFPLDSVLLVKCDTDNFSGVRFYKLELEIKEKSYFRLVKHIKPFIAE